MSRLINPPPDLGSGGETPWLVYGHDPEQCQTFASFSPLPPHNRSYVTSISSMHGKTIHDSCNGWLILRSDDPDTNTIFTLFNPLSSQFIQLPKLKETLSQDDEFVKYALISTPDLDDCVFLVLNILGEVFFCRPSREDCTWVKQKLLIDDDNDRTVSLFRVAVLDRIIYSMILSRSGEYHDDDDHNDDHDNDEIVNFPDDDREWAIAKIEVDDAKNTTLSLKRLVAGQPKCHIYWHTHHWELVASCGAIYYVERCQRNLGDEPYSMVKIWRLDLEELKWVDVHCLDGRAFFLGINGNCMSCWGSSDGDGVLGNCVYYISKDSLYNNDEAVYCYRLNDNTTTLLQSCHNLITPYTSLIWYKPQLHSDDEDRLLERQQAETSNQAVRSTIVSDKEQPQQSETQESLLYELLLDILNLISTKMHLLEYFKFRATCRLFRLLKGCDHNSLPYFIFFKDEFRLSQVVDPFQPSYSSSITIQPSQEPFIIDFIKNGWMLITVDYTEHSRHFFNPFTRERGTYPPLPDLDYLYRIGFSTYPTSADCLTVGFFNYTNTLTVYYHRHGDKTWSKCRFDQDLSFYIRSSGPVYYNGAFYILSYNGRLGEFKLEEGNASWKTYCKPHTSQSRKFELGTSCHLLECDGQLYAVHFGYYGKYLYVFRFNFSEQKWVLVKDIGHYCFFLSRPTSFSVDTYSANGIRNRIYFPRFKGRNGMVFYCLETCKYGVSGSNETLEDFFNTSEPLNHCWI